MQPPVEYRVAELERMAASIVRWGTVAELDAAAGRVKVDFGSEPGDGQAVTAWIPWAGGAAGKVSSWRPPSIGEQVMLLSPGGSLAAGAALPGVPTDAFPAPASKPEITAVKFADGATVSYDSEAGELAALLPEGATLKIESPGGASLLGGLDVAGNVDVDGTLTATGDISADGDITAKGDVSGANVSARGNVSDALGSMNEMRAVFNGHTHLVPGAPPTVVPAPVEKMA